MFDQAIKIDPKNIPAYNGKGLKINIIYRKFLSWFIKIRIINRNV